MRHRRGFNRLIEPQQELVKANKHLKALNREVGRFVGSQAYQLGKSTATGKDGTIYGTIYVKSCRPEPDSIPLMVEAVCSDLRSVLDHILLQLWDKKDPNKHKPVSFPICDTKSCFENVAPEHIGDLPLEQQAIFESVQPYNRENSFLSILRELSSADRHRLNPVVSTTSIIDQLKFKGMVSPGGKFRIITGQSGPLVLETGTELMRVPLEEFVGDFNVSPKFKYWQVFGKFPKIAEGLPVVKTLTAVRDEVKYVLGQFRPLLKG